MWKPGVLILIAITLSACTNEMVPYNNPPDYHNQLVQSKSGRWLVVPIQCPVVYDVYGNLKPSMNLNCASVRNLGLMLANPEDLLNANQASHQNKPTVVRTKPLAKAAQKYYNNDLPELQDTSTLMISGYYAGAVMLPEW